MPGTLVRNEGQPASGDTAADEAYDALGATFDFYKQVYGRCSIDAAGLPLIATVHFGQNYNNAQWDGSRMIFGDGDGALFNRFTASLDIVGHELTHGVTEHDAHLQYFQQSGALNESMADVFGSLVKQYALQQTAGRIWYNTLSNPGLRPSATFQEFAQVTLAVAQQLYNVGSAEANAVRYGWNTVGIAI